MRVMGIWAGFLFLCPRSHQLLSPSEASASFSQRGGSTWDEGEKGEGKASREGVWSDIENSRVIRTMSSQGQKSMSWREFRRGEVERTRRLMWAQKCVTGTCEAGGQHTCCICWYT